MAMAARRRPGRAVWLLLSAVTAFLLVQGMTMTLLPIYATRLGAPYIIIGLLVSVPGLVSLVCDLPGATFAEYRGLRRSLVISFCLTLVSVLAYGLALYYWWLVAIQVVSGLAGSLFWPAMLTYSSRVVLPEQQQWLQGLNGLVQGIGALIGTLAGGVLTLYMPIRAVFLLFGCVATTGLILVILLPPLPHGAGPMTMSRAMALSYVRMLRLLRREPALHRALVIVIPSALCYMTMANSFLPLQLSHVLSNLGLVGVIMATRSLAMTLMSPLFGPLQQRWGILRPNIVLALVGIVTLLGTPFTTSPVALAGLLLLQGIGFGLTPASLNTLVAWGVPVEDRAIGMAVPGLISRGTMMLAGLGLGIIAQSLGLTIVFIVCGVISLGWLAGCALLRSHIGGPEPTAALQTDLMGL